MEGIDVFHSSIGEKKTFQIIHYDIGAQKLKSVYLLEGNMSDGPKSDLDNELTKACEKTDIPITILIDGSVTLLAECNPNKFIVRATGNIKSNKTHTRKYKDSFSLFDPTSDCTDYQSYKAIYRTNKVTKWKDVQGKLRQLGSENMSTNAVEFPVTTFPAIGEATGLSDLDENTKHDIAKIVTELTVLSLGYNQMASKLPGNEGFDGVFTDPDQNQYIITESKCQITQIEPAQILEEFDGRVINGKIERSLAKNEDNLKRLRQPEFLQLVEELDVQDISHRIERSIKKKEQIEIYLLRLNDFIQNQPGHVLKLAHRTNVLGGKSQGGSKLLDVDIGVLSDDVLGLIL